MRTPPLALLASIALALVLAPLPALSKDGDLAPVKGWRIRPDSGAVSGSVDPTGAAFIPGLVDDEGTPWPAEAEGSAELEVELPELAKNAMLLAIEVSWHGEGTRKILVHGARKGPIPRQYDPVDSIEVGEKMRRKKKPRPQKRKGAADETAQVRVTIPAGRFVAVKLTLGEDGSPPPRLESLRIYKLDRAGRNDYWLFLGASIAESAIDPEAFAADLARRYPGFDPYIANEGKGGMGAHDLRKALPAILERHPHARYVAIEIGGVEVSAHRPFPAGKERLEASIEATLEAIQKSGRVPILSRLNYRAYTAKEGKPAVPPEENGALPYVTAIYDPLIYRFCPEFFDRKAKRGRVDFYTWFRENPKELSGDGITPTDKGMESVARIWIESAGAVVYGAPK